MSPARVAAALPGLPASIPDAAGIIGRVLGVLALLCLLAGCERPPVQSVQGGYRGTGMVQVYNPRLLDAQAALNAEPEIARPARVRPGQPLAGDVYENIKVLGDLSLAEFGRTMTAITAWVAPREGCAYCHEEGNLASDARYTKVVARRMLQMTQYLNATWRSHVAETGVTCYSCHRGNPVPRNLWFLSTPAGQATRFIGAPSVRHTALPGVAGSQPSAPFEAHLLRDDPIRIVGSRALPAGSPDAGKAASLEQAERSYGLMIHMSQALGVNCTFCHNMQSPQRWSLSSPQRVTAWHGLAMVREINQVFLTQDPLISIFPADRRGPLGDVAKVHCATCHQGANKPLYGSHLSRYYPAVVPPELRPDVPPTPPAVRQRLPAVRGELRAAGARDPAQAR